MHGSLVETFGNDEQTLVVARARVIHAGYTYLLRWGGGKR